MSQKNEHYVSWNEDTGLHEVYEWKTREKIYSGSQGDCFVEIDRIRQLKEDIQNMINYKDSHDKKDDDVVDKPSHYIGDLGLEVEFVLRNFIPRYENAYVAHRIASAIEYLLRSPWKNGTQDIEKARYNLDQALTYLEEQE